MVFEKKMLSPAQSVYLQALEFYQSIGVDEAVLDAPPDRSRPAPATAPPPVQGLPPVTGAPVRAQQAAPVAVASRSALLQDAETLAAAAGSLEDLRSAIAGFDGIAIKKTASNLVFADGAQNAKIMLIGDVPSADDDRAGQPFAGEAGQLLDKILASIGLARRSENHDHSVYLTNVLNWRPPGNRSPTPAEVELSRPFLMRHIALVRPEILILCGSVAAKAVLGEDGAISKLRTRWHDVTLQAGNSDEMRVSAFVTYHPASLIHTPSQKRAVWTDMQMLQEKLRDRQILA